MDGPNVLVSTSIWRVAVAACLIINSGKRVGTALMREIGRTGATTPGSMRGEYLLARAAILPNDLSTRAPLRIDDLHLLSPAVKAYQEEVFEEVLSVMRSAGATEGKMRVLLDQQQVPGWLARKQMQSRSVPWITPP